MIKLFSSWETKFIVFENRINEKQANRIQAFRKMEDVLYKRIRNLHLFRKALLQLFNILKYKAKINQKWRNSHNKILLLLIVLRKIRFHFLKEKILSLKPWSKFTLFYIIKYMILVIFVTELKFSHKILKNKSRFRYIR